MSDTIEALKQTLASLNPIIMDIQDDSALHAGHAGNTGGGHYTIFIVSDAFESLSLINRHRLVYDTVGSLMDQAIHALSIQAKTSSEYNSK
jgi:BolA family transcriptional regulator, general stress-responsive regulator